MFSRLLTLSTRSGPEWKQRGVIVLTLLTGIGIAASQASARVPRDLAPQLTEVIWSNTGAVYLVQNERIEWRSRGDGDVRLRSGTLKKQRCELLDFGVFRIKPKSLRLDFPDESQLLTKIALNGPILAMVPRDQSVRFLWDRNRTNTILIVEPTTYEAEIRSAISKKNWQRGSRILDEARTLGLKLAGDEQWSLKCLRGAGIQQLQLKHFPEALRLLHEYVSAFPKGHEDPEALLGLAEACHNTGDNLTAKQILLDLTERRPKGVDTLEILWLTGRVYLATHEFAKAILALDALATSNQSSGHEEAEVYFLLGVSCKENGEIVRAREAFARFSGFRTADPDHLKVAKAFLEATDHDGTDPNADKPTGDSRTNETLPAARSPQAIQEQGKAVPELGSDITPRQNPALTTQRSGLHLRLYGLDGKPNLDLSELGGKIAVIHLWATWCAPCLTELPSLAEFYRRSYPELKESGLVLLTVSNDLNENDLKKYLAGHKSEMPVYYDPLQKVNEGLGAGGSIPKTVVIGRNGAVLERLPSQDWRSSALLEKLRGLLAQK